MHANYPGGLGAYVSKGVALLQAAEKGDNPLEGWVPKVPEGVKLDFCSSEYIQL